MYHRILIPLIHLYKLPVYIALCLTALFISLGILLLRFATDDLTRLRYVTIFVAKLCRSDLGLQAVKTGLDIYEATKDNE